MEIWLSISASNWHVCSRETVGNVEWSTKVVNFVTQYNLDNFHVEDRTDFSNIHESPRFCSPLKRTAMQEFTKCKEERKRKPCPAEIHTIYIPKSKAMWPQGNNVNNHIRAIWTVHGVTMSTEKGQQGDSFISYSLWTNIFTFLIQSYTVSQVETNTFSNAVGTATGYRLDDRGSGVRFPAGAGKFSLLHRVQTGSGAHPAS
jgi:hypothetical protein